MSLMSPSLRISALCAFATFPSIANAVCTPTKTAASAKEMTMLEYNVTLASGGVYPNTKDHTEKAIGLAQAYGITVTGCPMIETFCQDAGVGAKVRLICPETCKITDFNPMRGIAMASPTGSGPFPLFVYFPGTTLCNTEPGPLQLVQAMVKRGFVSASVEYPVYRDYCDHEFHKKAETLANGAASPLGMLCAQPQVDCSLGIATAGYSQGSHMAVLAGQYEPRITAAMVIAGGRPSTCAVIDNAPRLTPPFLDIMDDTKVSKFLPKEKRRSVVVDLDQIFSVDNDGQISSDGALQCKKQTTGHDCGESLDCLQTDGSGYFVIKHTDLAPLPSFYAGLGLSWHEAIYDFMNFEFQPWFLEGPQPWTMTNNFDWLAKAAVKQLTSGKPLDSANVTANVTGTQKPAAISTASWQRIASLVVVAVLAPVV